MEKNLVIIPTYNEIENVEAMVKRVFSLPLPFHLLIVDDGSPDGTATTVRRLMEQYPDRLHLIEREGKLGLGTAYIAAFNWGIERGYDHLIEMDCDFSHNPDDLVRLVERCHEGYDVAIGSRYIQGVNIINWPMSRLLLSFAASQYVRLITRMDVRDATAGFVCYRRKVLETIKLDKVQMKGYGFQIEMKYSAHRLGFKVSEVSIIFTDRAEGNSKMSGGIFSEALFGVIKLPFRRY